MRERARAASAARFGAGAAPQHRGSPAPGSSAGSGARALLSHPPPPAHPLGARTGRPSLPGPLWPHCRAPRRLGPSPARAARARPATLERRPAKPAGYGRLRAGAAREAVSAPGAGSRRGAALSRARRGWVPHSSPVQLGERGRGPTRGGERRRRRGHDSCNLRRASAEPLSRRRPGARIAAAPIAPSPTRPGRRRLADLDPRSARRPPTTRLRLPGCFLEREGRSPRRTLGPRWLGWGLRAPLDAGGDSLSAWLPSSSQVPTHRWCR